MSAYSSVPPTRAPRCLVLQRSHHCQSCNTHTRIHITLFHLSFHNSRCIPLRFPLRKTTYMFKPARAHIRSINLHHNRCRVPALMVSRSKITDMALGVGVGAAM